MAEYNLVDALSRILQDPNQGGGVGLFPDSATTQIKAAMAVDSANRKMLDAANPPPSATVSASGGAPNAPDQLPLAQTMPIATPPAPGPSTMDSFVTAMNTPTGAAGAANLLGTLGAAVSQPGSWQSRLGTASAGLGQNVIAADRFGKVMDVLRPPAPAPAATPAAPAPMGGAPEATSNFHKALLTNPPLFKENEDLRLK